MPYTDFGRNFDVSVKFGIQAPTSTFFLRLIRNTSLTSANNFGSGLTEVTGTGYSAQGISGGAGGSWTISGDEATCEEVTFEIPDGVTWSGVTGYAISLTASGNNAVHTELFAEARRGDKIGPDVIKITPKFKLFNRA